MAWVALHLRHRRAAWRKASRLHIAGESSPPFNTVKRERNMDVGAAKTLAPAAVGKGNILGSSRDSN